ncbi:MAG: hypothetical protein GF381_01360, partial [Candidatus Pacebacteria bacterium]|nr:hypothetical protein [Candidatus Paceibacterota bacterium]
MPKLPPIIIPAGLKKVFTKTKLLGQTISETLTAFFGINLQKLQLKKKKLIQKLFKLNFFQPRRSQFYTHSLALSVGVVMFIAGTYFGLTHYLLPKIRALSESNWYMPYDETNYPNSSTAFNRAESSGLAGYDDDSGKVSVSASEVKLAEADDW